MILKNLVHGRSYICMYFCQDHDYKSALEYSEYCSAPAEFIVLLTLWSLWSFESCISSTSSSVTRRLIARLCLLRRRDLLTTMDWKKFVCSSLRRLWMTRGSQTSKRMWMSVKTIIKFKNYHFTAFFQHIAHRLGISEAQSRALDCCFEERQRISFERTWYRNWSPTRSGTWLK